MWNKGKEKQRIKKYTGMILAFFIVFTMFSQEVQASSTSVSIEIDGFQVEFNKEMGFPFVDGNQRTQVPLRVTLESFGAYVGYDAESRMAYAVYNDIVVYIPIGLNYIYVNEEPIENDTQAVIIDGRTYCPIRKVLEAFGASVNWEAETKTVVVYSSEENRLLLEEGEVQAGEVTELVARDLPVLTVLVRYQDQVISTTEQNWYEFWFAQEKSVKDYYQTMSKGTLNLVPVNEESGIKNNGIVVVELREDHPDYVHQGLDNFDSYMFFESIMKEVDHSINFSLYDQDKDTVIDPIELAVNIIVAGHEETYYTPEGVKAVSGLMITEGYYVEADGMNINRYAISGELMAHDEGVIGMSTIGVATHEFGHLLGLPDLYDVDMSTVGLDFHSLMGSGNNNYNFELNMGEIPVSMSAWERVSAGLVLPELVAMNGVYALDGSESGYNVLKIPTDDPKIYYLLENRPFSGYNITLDFYMDIPGIAVWRVNEHYIEKYYDDNSVMDHENERGITLLEAGDTRDLFRYRLDYYYTPYNHYYAKGYVDSLTTVEGFQIRILSPAQEVMEVDIEL